MNTERHDMVPVVIRDKSQRAGNELSVLMKLRVSTETMNRMTTVQDMTSFNLEETKTDTKVAILLQDSTLLSLLVNAPFHLRKHLQLFVLTMKSRLMVGEGEDVVSQAPTPDGRPAFG